MQQNQRQQSAELQLLRYWLHIGVTQKQLAGHVNARLTSQQMSLRSGMRNSSSDALQRRSEHQQNSAEMK